jgi:hypothetical protein
MPHAIAVLVLVRREESAATWAWTSAAFEERRRLVRCHPYSLVCAATKDHQGSSEKIAPVSVEPLTAWCNGVCRCTESEKVQAAAPTRETSLPWSLLLI